MIKKAIAGAFLVLCVLPVFSAEGVFASDNKVDVYFFWGEGCPHCAKEKVYLNQLEKERDDVAVHDYEIYNHPDNISLLKDLGQELGTRIEGVPFVVIGDKSFIGFSEKTTPPKLLDRIEYCSENQCSDATGDIIMSERNEGGPKNGENDIAPKKSPEKEDNDITIPVLGKIDPETFSLPLLTVVLGFLDGFNPCAMWTLLFLISLLLGMNDRKKMWILGISFIAASAFVYFLFMAAWLNLILFLGFIIWVRATIGLIALSGGVYNIREFFVNKSGTCKVTNTKGRKKVFDKIRDIIHFKSFPLALGGIILLAFAVNLVELVCSAGLPAVYAQVLALNDISWWGHYLYILLYVFVFMLDDLFVFFAAMITLRMTGITTKYTRASKIIGGILMVVIGLLLIFKPEVLMF